MLQDIRLALRILVRDRLGGNDRSGLWHRRQHAHLKCRQYAVLLRPLPVYGPNRLLCISADSPSRNLVNAFTAYSTYARMIVSRPGLLVKPAMIRGRPSRMNVAFHG